VAIGNNFVGNWPINWRATLPLSPGAHQLSVTALHPSGLFTTNRSVWFTNNASYEAATETYDAAGRITQRIWKSSSGTTNRTETLSWDVRGRLFAVIGTDSENNGYGWFATYDPLGRKIFTQTWITTNASQIGTVEYVPSYYDPQVEFLELGVALEGQYTTWKL